MPTDTAAPARQRDNLLGVCHALGQAFGFDPLYLRLAFLLGLLADFRTAAIVYAVAALAVLAGALADAACALRRRGRSAA